MLSNMFTYLLSRNQHATGYKIQKQDFLIPFYIIYYGLWCLFTETWLYSCIDQLPCKKKRKKKDDTKALEYKVLVSRKSAFTLPRSN